MSSGFISWKVKSPSEKKIIEEVSAGTNQRIVFETSFTILQKIQFKYLPLDFQTMACEPYITIGHAVAPLKPTNFYRNLEKLKKNLWRPIWLPLFSIFFNVIACFIAYIDPVYRAGV
jgi:hypothetical protein